VEFTTNNVGFKNIILSGNVELVYDGEFIL